MGAHRDPPVDAPRAMCRAARGRPSALHYHRCQRRQLIQLPHVVPQQPCPRLLRHVPQVPCDDVPRLGPRRIWMGIVVGPHQIVAGPGAEDPAGRRVVEERGVELAEEVLASTTLLDPE